jgi:N-acyl-L-homoserine lactone synthetase
VRHPEQYAIAQRIRAAVYVDEMGFLEPDHIDATGREVDAHDGHACHLSVVEAPTVMRSARVIGTIRLIVKADEWRRLPIEQDFPDAFVTTPAIVPAVEVSRFIARHEDPATQHLVAIALIRGVIYQSLSRGIDTAYFEIELPLLRLLESLGIPMIQIGEAREVNEPGGARTLYPLRTPLADVPNAVTTDESGRFSLRDFFQREEPTGGLGYFDDVLTSRPADPSQPTTSVTQRLKPAKPHVS